MLLLVACSPPAPAPAPMSRPPAIGVDAAGAPLPPPPSAWPAELPTRLVRLSAEGEAWVVLQPCAGEPATLEVDGGKVWFLGETGVIEEGNYTGILMNKAGYTLRYQTAQGNQETKLRWGDPTRSWLYVKEDRYAVPSTVGSRFLLRSAECPR